MDKLTGGCINQIISNGQTIEQPVVQVINIKKIEKQDKVKYKLIISDGTNFTTSLLSDKIIELMDDGTIHTHCLLRLKKYLQAEMGGGMKLIIVQEVEKVEYGIDEKIGNPVSLVDKVASQPKGPNLQNLTKPHNLVDTSDCQPINSLNPYNNNWAIKARVTRKDVMKTWNNARGTGQLFGFDLLDNSGAQIRATLFNEAASKYFDMIQEKKVYKFSKGQVKIANRRFNHLPNDYEIAFGNETTIQEVAEDDSIQQIKFVFVPIDNLKNIQPNKHIDLLGNVHNVSPLSKLTSKAGKELTKRTMTIVDESLLSVEVTLWNERAHEYNEETCAGNPVIAFKSLRVSEFGGRSLSASWNSQIKINPNLPKAKKLKEWYKEKGISSNFESISQDRSGGTQYPRTPVKEANELGKSTETPDSFTNYARIIYVRVPSEDRNPWYPACQAFDCKRKVIQDAGEWRCEKCSKSFPAPLYRWIISFVIADDTESMWVTGFNDIAEKILKVKAVDAKKMLDNGEKKAFEAIFKNCLFVSAIFAIKAITQITPMGEPRVKRTAVGMRPIDYLSESRLLLEKISAMEN